MHNKSPVKVIHQNLHAYHLYHFLSFFLFFFLSISHQSAPKWVDLDLFPEISLQPSTETFTLSNVTASQRQFMAVSDGGTHRKKKKETDVTRLS